MAQSELIQGRCCVASGRQWLRPTQVHTEAASADAVGRHSASCGLMHKAMFEKSFRLVLACDG